jgi:hypothetical protein
MSVSLRLVAGADGTLLVSAAQPPRRKGKDMSTQTPQHLTDEDIETVYKPGDILADAKDADGTDADADGQDADGTDGDATDSTDGDATDTSDGDATDTSDGDATDADGQDA